jgi:hypothetical protein
MENKDISISEIRTAVNSILDFIEHDLQKNAVDLNKNFYWTVPYDDVYNVQKNPTDLYCGSLLDDVEFVKKMLLDKDTALPLMLLHVVPLLQYIALNSENFRNA